MAMTVDMRSGFTVETPDPLFSVDQTNLIIPSAPLSVGVPYDVTRDGQRFVMVRPSGQAEDPTPKIIVVENWSKQFEKRQ